MISENYLFWIDLEMSGLNVENDVILEIASVITDNNLNIIAEGPDLVIHQPSTILDGMDEWNRTHHGKSGLTKKVHESTISLDEAYEKTLDFAKAYCKPQSAPLCGNTVYQDKKFLQKYMPELDRFFHYRIIDVSTVKELVRRWYPQDPCTFFEKKTAHRALEDVYESIEELRHYKHYFFAQMPR